MNTLNSRAASRSVALPALLSARTRGSRALAALSFALAVPLLAACSSDGGDSSGTGPTSASSTASATSSPFATPTIAANGDPFCDIAVAAQEDATANAVTTGEFETIIGGIATGTTPVSDLNAWGTALAELATRSIQFYDESEPLVAGTAAESDFAASRIFVSEYSLPLGTMAATTTDPNAFLEQMATFVQTPEVQSIITTGPAAAEGVSAYITERCPSDA